jgi:hypothetical protein
MRRARKKLPPQITGVDILLGKSSEALERTDLELPRQLVEAFRQQLLEGYIRPRDMSDPNATPSGPRGKSDLRPDELVALSIVAVAVDYAFNHADLETQTETLWIGIVTAMRFAEFLKSIGHE